MPSDRLAALYQLDLYISAQEQIDTQGTYHFNIECLQNTQTNNRTEHMLDFHLFVS